MNQINIPYKLKILNSNEEIFQDIEELLKEEELKRIAVITSKTPTTLITNNLETFLFNKVEKIRTFQTMEASHAFVNQIPLNDIDVVIGVGGGKVIDVAKYAAFSNNIPCISIPTSISNDGICSPISVLKEKHNKYKSYGAAIPFAMYVPLHLLMKSDREYILSGVGDLITNLSGIEDWRLSHRETGEMIDDYAVIIAENAANTILLSAEKYILLRKSRDQFLSENMESIVNSLALSGIAMEIAGTSRPASGAEHLISHAMDELYGGFKQHGEQVAFGMLLVSFIRYKRGYISKERYEELRAVIRYLGLPATMSILEINREQLKKVILHAPKTRPERYTILNKVNLTEDELDQLLDELFGPEKAIDINKAAI